MLDSPNYCIMNSLNRKHLSRKTIWLGLNNKKTFTTTCRKYASSTWCDATPINVCQVTTLHVFICRGFAAQVVLALPGISIYFASFAMFQNQTNHRLDLSVSKRLEAIFELTKSGGKMIHLPVLRTNRVKLCLHTSSVVTTLNLVDAQTWKPP